MYDYNKQVYLPMKQDFIELESFLVNFKFWSAAMTANFKYNRLRVFLDAADEWVFIEIPRSREGIHIQCLQ